MSKTSILAAALALAITATYYELQSAVSMNAVHAA